MKTTFDGEAGAVGSSYYWTGNDKVGEGRMTIFEARPGEKVGIKLEFLRPFASQSDTSFTVAPSGTDRARVTWVMEGHNNFVGKAFGLVMDMDKMIGSDFDKGLAQLGAVASAEAHKAAPPAAAPPAAPLAVPAAALEGRAASQPR